jgi:dUTP pyrophosphatase
MSATLTIKVINRSKHELPKYATQKAAGLDLKADIATAIVLKPLQRQLIPTGLFIELPEGFEAQIRPRSGLAFKNGITVLNSPGTIDADYRGEIKVLLVNLSDTEFTINDGERIAQMVVARHEQIEWNAVSTLEASDRGAGGFGSTGKK